MIDKFSNFEGLTPHAVRDKLHEIIDVVNALQSKELSTIPQHTQPAICSCGRPAYEDGMCLDKYFKGSCPSSSKQQAGA